MNKYCFDYLIELFSDKPGTRLILPTDPIYATARLIYNKMYDSHPGLIIQTMDVDVLRSVLKFAVENDVILAIRGGGHHIGGFGTCNDGIVIDFSPFKDVHINIDENIASVSPGANLGDVDTALSQKGYIIPTGTVSETGMAGLTLGGGIGWLVGQYGLTCDQLCGADVLLANGQLIRAEDPEHQDLLWALRGGGGNFGIVLKFRYSLNKLPKTICGSGLVNWENAADVMTVLHHYLQNACPTSMTIAPVFTQDKRGKPTLRIDFCCADGIENDVTQLLSLSPLINWFDVAEREFATWQKQFDHLFLNPLRGYWKAAYVEKITPEMIQSMCQSFENLPACECSILIEHLHGAFKKYDQTTSAFPLRHINFGILYSARWKEAYDDPNNISWVREGFNGIDPGGSSGTYSNYTCPDDQRAIQNLLSSSTSRIASVKLRYDPDNFFKRNHNVLPSKTTRKQEPLNCITTN